MISVNAFVNSSLAKRFYIVRADRTASAVGIEKVHILAGQVVQHQKRSTNIGQVYHHAG